MAAPKPFTELLVNAPCQASTAEAVGADRVQPHRYTVIAQQAGPDDEDPRLTTRDLGLVLANRLVPVGISTRRPSKE
ncbi:hypothetical protein GCM10023067_56790 [Aminobacter aganoensis]